MVVISTTSDGVYFVWHFEKKNKKSLQTLDIHKEASTNVVIDKQCVRLCIVWINHLIIARFVSIRCDFTIFNVIWYSLYNFIHTSNWIAID